MLRGHALDYPRILRCFLVVNFYIAMHFQQHLEGESTEILAGQPDVSSIPPSLVSLNIWYIYIRFQAG